MMPTVQAFHLIAKEFVEANHPRVPAGSAGGGEFASGGGTGESTGTGTKQDPIVTSDVLVAAKALNEDKYVRLKSVKQVSTLLGKMKEIVDECRVKGEKSPNFDLCHVTVPGTSLFCAESKGIPRVQMPQLKGVPTPGSKADALPKSKDGEVNLSDEFMKHLAAAGIAVHDETERADYLKASQSELNGAKVASMAAALATGKADKIRTDPIFVSRDNYIIDGHHSWAATVGVDSARTSGDHLKMNLHRVDLDIIETLRAANRFASDWGIPQAGVGQMQKSKCCGGSCGCHDAAVIADFVGGAV